jgi:hypothetical protein
MNNKDFVPKKDTEFNIFQKGVMTPVKAIVPYRYRQAGWLLNCASYGSRIRHYI